MEDALGPLFVHQAPPQFLWMLGLAAAAVAIGIAAYVLIRGQVPAELGVIGLVAVPALVLLIANLVVLERSKEMAFCGSCHEPMAPLVASVIEPNGTLASIHYQSGAVKGDTACYTCHSGYGLLGDVAAKRAGVRHMWHALRGGYEYPLAMNQPFDIGACLDCHRHAPSFRAVPFHMDPGVQASLVSHEMSCTGSCHPSAHPPEALNGSAARSAAASEAP